MTTPDASMASKEAVLEAARSLLLQHGYAGLSMRELAHQSGLAKGTIYHHFHDKRAIYLNVLERDLAIARRCIQYAAGEGDVIERLRRVIRTYFKLHQERRLVILTALRDTTGLEAPVCALLRRYEEELLQPIRAIIAEATAAGVMRPVPVELTATSLLGMLQGFIGHQTLAEETGNDVVDQLLDLLLNGLLIHDDATHPMHDT